jgi:hypothetical protein
MTTNDIIKVLDTLPVIWKVSKVDETKTLEQMKHYWVAELSKYPNVKVGSMIRYNINRDFDCL